ncbi:hypothetical protein FQR65_LT14043 [Abscondita terminalis]|nr:hypothetical protein FQR65_LT14043 [Abscondita terminalis]
MCSNYQHRIRSQLFKAASQAEEEIMTNSNRPPSTLSSASHHSPLGFSIQSPPSWSQSQIPVHHSEEQHQHETLQDVLEEPAASQAEEEIMTNSNRPPSTLSSASHHSPLGFSIQSPPSWSQSQIPVHHSEEQHQHETLQDVLEEPGISGLANYLRRFPEYSFLVTFYNIL